nr:uncharacterized protein CTRU02_03648 [Colletotrichum truncatum]KAF6796670.1 hypothetical protein CTRU02_03648 [Colletotrichum truncatum]
MTHWEPRKSRLEINMTDMLAPLPLCEARATRAACTGAVPRLALIGDFSLVTFFRAPRPRFPLALPPRKSPLVAWPSARLAHPKLPSSPYRPSAERLGDDS